MANAEGRVPGSETSFRFDRVRSGIKPCVREVPIQGHIRGADSACGQPQDYVGNFHIGDRLQAEQGGVLSVFVFAREAGEIEGCRDCEDCEGGVSAGKYSIKFVISAGVSAKVPSFDGIRRDEALAVTPSTAKVGKRWRP